MRVEREQSGPGQPVAAGGRSRGLAWAAGFLVPVAAIGGLGWAFAAQAHPWGWRGGEYAYAFAGLVLGGLLLGALLLAVSPRRALRSFGKGLLLGASLGVVLGAGLIALLMYALSQADIPF